MGWTHARQERQPTLEDNVLPDELLFWEGGQGIESGGGDEFMKMLRC